MTNTIFRADEQISERAGKATERSLKKYQLFIDGTYVDPLSGEWFESMDPYRGEPLARIPRSSDADLDRAVKAANKAMREAP